MQDRALLVWPAAVRSRWRLLTETLGLVPAIVFAAGAVASHVVAAWCNAGFLSPDEHYQILEFAQYTLGYQSASSLAWEFAMHMRPTLQPWLAAAAIHTLHLAGVTSPFAIAFSLRLVSALLAMVVSLELCARCLPAMTSRGAKQAALFLSFFVWLVPTAHGRFSSENWGGIGLAAGICFVLDALDAEPRSPARAKRLAVVAGLLWAVAFYCRFQIGFAIAGALLWLVFVRRPSGALARAIALGLAAGVMANEILDYGLYGTWTIAPLNYLWQNLVEGRAAAFGTAPWWMIGIHAAVALIPPFSLAMIGILAVGSWLARRDLFVWTAVPFLVLHAVVARKDPRFLIPLLYILGPWFGVCVDRLCLGAPDLSSRWRRSVAAATRTFCVVNVGVMSVVITLPANGQIAFDQWAWQQRRSGVRTMYAFNLRETGLPDNVTNSFYRTDITMVPFSEASRDRSGGSRFVYYSGTTLPEALASAGCTQVLWTYPPWITEQRWIARLSKMDAASACELPPAPR
jgi:phosphatidylinositol glycan class B